MEAAEYDLIVAGAGPAGSACAITAARAGLKVLLLEKDRFPRQKVCGEFVSPESLGLLQGLLGETIATDYLRIGRTRIILDGKTLTLPVSPAAQSIPRFEMDASLFRAAQHAGVCAQEGVNILGVENNGVQNNGSQSNAAQKNETHPDKRFHVRTAGQTFTAMAVVNSTGRWSKLTQFDVAGKHRWIGLKAHFREASPSMSVDLYFFPGGYCGVTPVSADAINACAMVRADVAHSLDEVFTKEPALFERSRTWQPLFDAVTTSPLYFREPETVSDGMLLAGDAAGFIDPFAGDGISLALQSGTLAGETMARFVHGKCSLQQAYQQYRAAYRKRFAPAFRNAARLRSAFAAPKWVRSAALSFAAIPGVGKMLINMTRARSS